jgi:hypothetical protein
MLQKGLIFLVLILTVSSCDLLTNNPAPPQKDKTLYPLTVGNYWQYNNFFISEPQSDTTYLDPTITTVVGTKKINGITFQELQTHIYLPRYIDVQYLFSRNDSIFEKNYSGSNQLALKYIKPQQDTVNFFYDIGNRIYVKTAYRMDTTIVTPAGKFSDCYFYDFDQFDFRFRDIIVPDVGIIKSETYYYREVITPDSLEGVHIYELTNYNVQK